MRNRVFCFFLILLGFNNFLEAQQKQSTYVDSLLSQNKALQPYLKDFKAYQIQIYFTQIDRDSLQNPILTHHYWGLSNDSSTYFYPASLAKLPLALLSLEKINQLQVPNLHKFTSAWVDRAVLKQPPVQPITKTPSNIAFWVRQSLLISDNEAPNLLYDFLGQEHIHRQLAAKGFSDCLIRHRFGLPLAQQADTLNQWHASFNFYKGEQPLPDSLVWQQIAYKSPRVLAYTTDDTLAALRYANKIPLKAAHQMLTDLIFPEKAPPHRRFQLTTADYDFLYQAMGTLPRESQWPDYKGLLTPGAYPPDGYRKFIGFAMQPSIPAQVRVLNKVGIGLDYTSDVAYFIDFENQVEFLLSAVVANRKFNQYEEAYAFLRALGQTIWQAESKRDRKFKPDLSKFSEMVFE
ncbi:MAG TPA: hypothetical protein DCM08_09140 [Microscillaceae bacterium]|nr:hypothetical protein [Microscillaceae bacterium]